MAPEDVDSNLIDTEASHPHEHEEEEVDNTIKNDIDFNMFQPKSILLDENQL